MDRVIAVDRSIRLEALPIGIATNEWLELSRDDVVRPRVHELRSRHAGRQLIVSVDRLDYTKGIPERLRTFRRLLRSSPEWRAKVTLIQVAVPSRERVPAYAELRREVAELVGEVNGDFGTPEWQPIVYLRRSVVRQELAALYAAADVCWVGPLRDGMNLVAKEFVASQRGRDGILVLSEFAGAAQELGEALRINPYDEDGTAAVVERALGMPVDRRRERMGAMFERIRRDDAVAWSERFLASLRAATSDGRPDAATERPEPDPRRLVASFAAASERFILLDYDGTLVPLTQRPADAEPRGDLVDLLRRLAAVPQTTVAVVSGRPRSDIERWFGELARLWLAAEHGALVRVPGEAWRPLRSGADPDWKARVRPLLEQFARSAPGSFVEEKELSLGWHYRLADPEFGAWLANELVSTLDQLLAGTELSVLRGHKVVEVHFAWAHKGEVAATLRPRSPRGRFILAIGDDRTDEDMFARLPASAWTIRVGRGSTRARFSVRDPDATLALLALLAEAGGG
jgi:trehalose 6-phosphate synthase/phosphatase